jgi:hypothetical protein
LVNDATKGLEIKMTLHDKEILGITEEEELELKREYCSAKLI